MSPLTKIILRLKKTRIIIVFEEEDRGGGEEIFQTLKPFFKIKRFFNNFPSFFDILNNEILLFQPNFDSKNFSKILKLAKTSLFPILVVMGVSFKEGEASFQDENKLIRINKAVELLPAGAFLILNSDEKLIHKIGGVIRFRKITFGFEERADFRASDVHITEDGMNFKINYDGKIIPIWQSKTSEKNSVYNALAASCVGIILGLNFVEISEALRRENKIDKK